MDSGEGALLRADFARLWTGNTASGLATWALPFVLGLSVVNGLLGPLEVGAALAARTLGFLTAVPIGGVYSDRLGPRRAILAASVLAACGIPLIVIGFGAEGAARLALVLAGAAISGFGQGACRPAYQAITPLVVPRERLQAANAALSLSVRVTNLLGPLAATGLALYAGVPAALLVVAALWLTSALLPPFPPRPEPRPAAADGRGPFRRFFADFAEGLAEARRHPWFVAGLAALTAMIATGYSVSGVLVPILSEERYGGPALLASSATAYTLGALITAFWIARWTPRRIGMVALIGLSLYGLVPFSLLIGGPIAVPIVAFFIAGVGIELFNVPWFTAVQREVPKDRLARVSSVDFVFSYGLAPLGLAAIAPLAELFGTGPVLLVCGMTCIAAPLLALLHPASRTFATARE